jgi:hypothetical protein
MMTRKKFNLAMTIFAVVLLATAVYSRFGSWVVRITEPMPCLITNNVACFADQHGTIFQYNDARFMEQMRGATRGEFVVTIDVWYKGFHRHAYRFLKIKDALSP